MRIATCQIEDTTTEDGKNAAAVALGRMGGKDYSVRFAVARLFRESGLIVATISAYSENDDNCQMQLRRGVRTH
jgi:hypothetical protein